MRVHVSVLTATTVLATALGTWLVLNAPAAHAVATKRPPAVPVQNAGSTEARQGADMGATYYWLEGRARKATSRFRDGSVVAERAPDGDIRARILDEIGNEKASLQVDRVTPAVTQLRFHAGSSRVNIESRPDLVHTLEWANLQARALAKDRSDERSAIEWQGRLARTKGPKADALEDEPLEIRAEFGGDISATTAKNDQDVKLGSVLRHPTFITHVVAEGVEVGVMRWYEQEQILAWDFPGLNREFLNAEHLKPIGGWTFKPTMAWANVQGLAFYEFHKRVKEQGAVARTCQPRPSRLANLLMPTVHANDDGCDYLHYLDGSIFRPCCDQHDRCYTQYGCSSQSWYWPWSYGWECTECNIGAAFCFVGGMQLCLDSPRDCVTEHQWY